MKIETYANTEKQNQILELLKFGTVMVFVDARHEEVRVPDGFKTLFDLRLNFDYDFGIDDFRILPDRLEASLTFENKRFFCVIPFAAVYLIGNVGIKRGSLFPESVPAEMLTYFFNASEEEKLKQTQGLKVIEGDQPKGEPSNQETANASEPTESSEPKRGHLRLVK